MTKPSIELSGPLFSMGSVINTEFRLGAKGENGIGKLAEASPPAPDFTAESSRNQFSQKFGKKFDFGPVGPKDDHLQISFEWVGWSSYCLVAIFPL